MRKAIVFVFLFAFGLSLSSQNLPTGCYYVKPKSDSTILVMGKTDSLWIDPSPIITIKDFKKVEFGKDSSGYFITIILKRKASEKFRIATGKWVQKKIAILVKDEIISAPTVVFEIGGGKMRITNGSLSGAQMEEMQISLQKEIRGRK